MSSHKIFHLMDAFVKMFFLYSKTRLDRTMSVRNLQFNRLWLALLGSDALVVALDCLLTGQVALACISLVDQELDIHLHKRKISY